MTAEPEFSLEQATIFLALAGSQAQGTARAGSDIDLRGVCIAPMPIRLSLFKSFEQYEGPMKPGYAATFRSQLERFPAVSNPRDIKIECVIFDIAKFIRLCSAANPNALEILFTPEPDWLLRTGEWRRLHSERQRFLTRKVEQTFLGYAMAQLRKIKARRNRPISSIQGGRAELERQHGYDTKHAMHLIRLMRMGLEVLRDGRLVVRRPDAEDLLAIRDGALSYDELLAEAASLENEVKRAGRNTMLPQKVDRNFVDRLAYELMSVAM